VDFCVKSGAMLPSCRDMLDLLGAKTRVGRAYVRRSQQ
jgi:hypothetical protein